MKTSAFFFAVCLLASAIGPALAAQATTVAFLGTTNSGGDARYDYLEPLISGLVLYDLSSTESLALTDRGMLEDVLREQEISLNLGKGDAAKLGGILGARWIAKAEYAVMGQDVSVSLTVVDVESAQAFVFTDRGTDENLVHGIVEKAVKKLCGTDAVFRSEQRQRSLLSLKDVKPGSINLHCALIDAQIFIDGAFAGYSLGDIKKALVFDNVDPGKHVIAVKLSGFGAVKLPEVEYVEWEKTVEVLPGKNLAVRVDARIFSDLYYTLSKFVDETFKLVDEPGKNAKEFKTIYPYTDRKGISRPISLSYKALRDAKGGKISGEISIDGKSAPIELACENGKETKAEIAFDPVKLIVSIDFSASYRSEYRVRLERSDIEFGEWAK
jgi:hypothetical protein